MLLFLSDLAVIVLLSLWNKVSWRLSFRRPVPGSRFPLKSLLLIGMHVLVAVAILTVLGVPASVLLSLMSAGVALGIFSDTYNGTRFLAQRPYRIGDLVEVPEDKISGVVSQISFGATTIRRDDGSEAIVPVKRLSDRIIVCRSRNDHAIEFRLDVDRCPDLDDLVEQIEAATAASVADEDRTTYRVTLASIEQDLVRFKLRLSTPLRSEDVLTDTLARGLVARFEKDGYTIRHFARFEDGAAAKS